MEFYLKENKKEVKDVGKKRKRKKKETKQKRNKNFDLVNFIGFTGGLFWNYVFQDYKKVVGTEELLFYFFLFSLPPFF